MDRRRGLVSIYQPVSKSFWPKATIFSIQYQKLLSYQPTKLDGDAAAVVIGTLTLLRMAILEYQLN